MNELDRPKNNEQKMPPSEAVLLKCMEMEWQDHFQTRNQTWKSLEIEAVLAIGLIGIDLKLNNVLITSIVGILLIISAFFGYRIAVHHRNNVELIKFGHIIDIEKRLGMLESDLFGDVKKPAPFRWQDIFSFKSNTSLFIIRMHIALMIFGIIYIVSSYAADDRILIINTVFTTALQAVWLMLPAYIANPTAVVFGGGKPIDSGKNWMDGRRIFGDGKTYRGLIGGTACGIVIGIIQMQMVWQPASFTYAAIIALSFGALLGDIVKSFFKRRLGFERGAKFPLVDQLDFVVGAWVMTYILDPEWFMEHFTLWIMAAVLIITPALHRVTNIIGYYAKLKKEPW